MRQKFFVALLIALSLTTVSSFAQLPTPGGNKTPTPTTSASSPAKKPAPSPQSALSPAPSPETADTSSGTWEEPGQEDFAAVFDHDEPNESNESEVEELPEASVSSSIPLHGVKEKTPLSSPSLAGSSSNITLSPQASSGTPSSSASSSGFKTPTAQAASIPSSISPETPLKTPEEQFKYSSAHNKAASGEKKKIEVGIKETMRYSVLATFLNSQRPKFEKVKKNMGIAEKLEKFKKDYDAKKTEPIDITGLSARARIEMLREVIKYKRETLPKHKNENWEVRQFFDQLPTPLKIGSFTYNLDVNPTNNQPGNGELETIGSYKSIIEWLQTDAVKANIPEYSNLLLIQRKYGDPINTGDEIVDRHLNGLNLLLDFEVARRLIDGDEFRDLPVLIHIEHIIKMLASWGLEVKDSKSKGKKSQATKDLDYNDPSQYPSYIDLFNGDKRLFIEHEIARLDDTHSHKEKRLSKAAIRRKLESSHKVEENSEDEEYFNYHQLSREDEERIRSEYLQREKDFFLKTIVARYMQKLKNDNKNNAKSLPRIEMELFIINEIFREKPNGEDLVSLTQNTIQQLKNNNLFDIAYDKLKERQRLSLVARDEFQDKCGIIVENLSQVIYYATNKNDMNRALKFIPSISLQTLMKQLADSVKVGYSPKSEDKKMTAKSSFVWILRAELNQAAQGSKEIKAAKNIFKEEGLKTIKSISKELVKYMLQQAVLNQKNDPAIMNKFKEVINKRFIAIFAAKNEEQLIVACDKFPCADSLVNEAVYLAKEINKLPMPLSEITKEMQDFVKKLSRDQYEMLFSHYVTYMAQPSLKEIDQEIDRFLANISKRYMEAIRDPSGETWGGDIELGRIADLYQLNIVVYQENGNGELAQVARFDGTGATRTIYILYKGDHYEVCDENGKIIGQVRGDGNCLFRAIVRQLPNGQEDNEDERIKTMREEVAEALQQEVANARMADNPIVARFLMIFATRNGTELRAQRGLLQGALFDEAQQLVRRRWGAEARHNGGQNGERAVQNDEARENDKDEEHQPARQQEKDTNEEEASLLPSLPINASISPDVLLPNISDPNSEDALVNSILAQLRSAGLSLNKTDSVLERVRGQLSGLRM